MIHRILQSTVQTGKRATVLAAILTASLLSLLMPASNSAQVLDRVVAVVNNDIITLSELEQTGKEYLSKIRETTPEVDIDQALATARDNLLDKLIDQHLVSQQATLANVTISDEEFENNYQNSIRGMNMSREMFLEQLTKAGLSEKNYRDNLRNQLLRDKLILYEVRSKIIITEEMMMSYYEKEYIKEVQGGGFHLLQMGFSWENPGPAAQNPDEVAAAKAHARQKAEDARRQVLDGDDFASVARLHSDLPSAVDGGDLGFFRKDEMAPYMREAVLPLKAGDLSPIIETPTEYQFFKLLAGREGDIVYQTPFDTVKEDIRKKLFEEKFKVEFRNWVDRIKKDAYIKKML